MNIRLNHSHIPRIIKALEGMTEALKAEREDFERACIKRQEEISKWKSRPFYVRYFFKKPQEIYKDPRFDNNHGWWTTEAVHTNTLELINKKRRTLAVILEALSHGENLEVSEQEYNLLRSDREHWVQLLKLTSSTVQ